MAIIVDSNILLDILTEDKNWHKWSSEMVSKYSENHRLIINQMIFAEISIRFSRIEEVHSLLEEAGFIYENLPLEAAFLAGKCFLKYKKQSGNKASILSDFYIGAHAAVTSRPVLTRDKSRYIHYFANLEIISS